MFTQYYNIIRRRLWVVLLLPLLGGILAFAGSKLVTPQYEAALTLWVSQASSASGQQYADILASERLAKTYGALITKRPVLQATINQLGLSVTPEQLSPRISVKMVRDTQLLEVSARDTSPERAAAIVNKLADVFQTQNTETQRQSFEDSMGKLNAQATQLEGQIKTTQAQINDLREVANQTPDQKAEMERLSQSLAQYQVTYSSVLKSVEDIRLGEASSANTVTVAEQAAVPDAPVSPKVGLNVAAGVALALLLAAGIVALLEYMDDSFKSAEDLQSTLKISALGALEVVGGKRPDKRKSNSRRAAPVMPLVSLEESSSHITEAYRVLRTNLEFASLDKAVHRLLITSAMPQEGKSTSSANLAVVLAQSGKRVLLVDIDLRRPSIHKLFKVPNHCGLTNVLLGSSNLDEAVQEVGVENLRVLSTGPLPPSPADTASSKAMEALLSNLESRYDIVLLDSPPVVVASDAVSLASKADGVLLVVAAYTSKRVVKTTIEALKRSGSPILGAVLNKLPATNSGSYYYYEYTTKKADSGADNGSRSRSERPGLATLAATVQKNKGA